MKNEIIPLSEPIMRDAYFRADMTTGCRDSDYIPKVANAGDIIFKNGLRLQIMHNGVKVVAGGYGGEWMAGIITKLGGHHEPQEEAVFHELMKLVPAKATMIELGGFWSYYSLWFLKKAAAKRKSIVVEPDARNLAIGEANAAANRRSIEFVNASVGARSAKPRKFTCDDGEIVKVPQVTVAELMQRFDMQVLDVLHCDIQGFETEVLQSCKNLLEQGKIRFCVVSTHTHFISGDPLTHQRCLKIIQDAGGQVLAEHDVHESFSGDGLIVAYFGKKPIKWTPPHLSYNRYATSLFRNPLFDLDEINQGKIERAQKTKL